LKQGEEFRNKKLLRGVGPLSVVHHWFLWTTQSRIHF